MDILLLSGLFFLNGLFAMSEIAIVSSSKFRLQQAVQDGVSTARLALQLANEPGHFLSTIQVGITLIGIMSGAIGEATLAGKFEGYLHANFPEMALYSRGISLTLVVVGITYFSLIIGELVPKRLALIRPERVAMFVARPMVLLSYATYPLVRLLSWSTDLALFLLRVKKSDDPLVTEREIRLMIDQGTEAGVFHKGEKAMVSNVMKLDALKVGAVMTPRIDMFYLDVTNSDEENRRRLIESPHSIVPLCKGGLDNVVGVIESKNILKRVLAGSAFDLEASIRPVIYIPNSLSPAHLLEEFKRSKVSLALVVDEYGEIAGLVTLKDVMEAIVGEIPSDEFDADEPEAIQRADGSWLIDGAMPVERFGQIFDLDAFGDSAEGAFHTMAGFVMSYLGHIPKASDHFSWNNFKFEVMDMDRNRVDKILVTREVAIDSDD